MEKYDVRYFSYDVERYPFIELVENLFGVSDLSEIHSTLDAPVTTELFTNENDDVTALHNKFYSKLNSGWDAFDQAYLSFVEMVMKEVFGVDSIIYQASPTFRVQLPNNIAVGGNERDAPERYGWHKDTDKEYNHPPFEKNFIVPLTNANDTASVYIETSPGSNEFNPADMRVGEYFQFAGGECLHGNKPNITGKSRVSIDFRLVLKEDYIENYARTSKLSEKKFVVGGYYREIS